MLAQRLEEGNIKFYTYVDMYGKVSKDLPVFYNPEKEEDRDICEALISEIKPQKALDLLAGTGVRGLRLAKLGVDTTINDWNKKAFSLMKRNAKLNKLDVRLCNENAHRLITEGTMYDYIDIDPYGSPLPFVDSSLKALRNKGCLGVCATDTGALAGSFPKVCFRRYGSKPIKTVFYVESGLRILIKKIIEVGAQYDYAMVPIYAHSTIQGYRAYFRKEKGSARTDKLLKDLENIDYCKKHGCVYCDCKNKIGYGKLYMGKMWDQSLANKIKSTNKTTELISDEADYPSFHYDIGKLSSSIKKSEPKFLPFLKEVKGVRTHFNKKGFRTKKPFKQILSTLKKFK